VFAHHSRGEGFRSQTAGGWRVASSTNCGLVRSISIRGSRWRISRSWGTC